MAIRNADRRRHSAIVAVALLAGAYLLVSKWDQDAVEELAAEAARTPARTSLYLADLKQRALMYAVEEAGHREYFAAALHCRAPIRGERLVMQHAHPRDPGRGYRCVYWVTSPALERQSVNWSRSPELEIAARAGGTR